VNSENPSWAATGRHLVYASNDGMAPTPSTSPTLTKPSNAASPLQA
jgi:Tol biopolymer transport system component